MLTTITITIITHMNRPLVVVEKQIYINIPGNLSKIIYKMSLHVLTYIYQLKCHINVNFGYGSIWNVNDNDEN